jgi:hypothetical protein
MKLPRLSPLDILLNSGVKPALTVLVLLTASGNLMAEEPPQLELRGSADELVWVQGGLGLSTGPGNDPPDRAFALGISYLAGSRLLAVRFHQAIETCLFCNDEPTEKVWDIAALYGYEVRSENTQVGVAAGIGLIGVVRRGALLRGRQVMFGPQIFEKEVSHAAGLSLKQELFWTPHDALGIGYEVAGNLNAEKSFASILVEIMIKFRPGAKAQGNEE